MSYWTTTFLQIITFVDFFQIPPVWGKVCLCVPFVLLCGVSTCPTPPPFFLICNLTKLHFCECLAHRDSSHSTDRPVHACSCTLSPPQPVIQRLLLMARQRVLSPQNAAAAMRTISSEHTEEFGIMCKLFLCVCVFIFYRYWHKYCDFGSDGKFK